MVNFIVLRPFVEYFFRQSILRIIGNIQKCLSFKDSELDSDNNLSLKAGISAFTMTFMYFEKWKDGATSYILFLERLIKELLLSNELVFNSGVEAKTTLTHAVANGAQVIRAGGLHR